MNMTGMSTRRSNRRAWLAAATMVGAVMLAPVGGAWAQAPSVGAPSTTPPSTAPQAKVGPPPAAPMTMATGKAGMQPLPTSVVLFPAAVSMEGASGAAAMDNSKTVLEAQEIVADELQRTLNRGGVGVVPYSRQLPSVQRAVSEGTLKADDAASGPGDDPRKAQRIAGLLGATEYISVSVENYKYDSRTGRVSFTLNAFRNAADGTPLGTSAQNAAGVAPEDVAGPRQQGSATARAAQVVAEQTVQALYPQTTALLTPKVESKTKKHIKGIAAFIVPIVAGVVYLASPK